MEWQLTLLAVHVVWFVLAVVLFRAAPCWMQRIAMGFFIVAMGVMVWAYAEAMLGNETWWHVAFVAFVIEHIGLLVYLFRVWWQLWERRHAASAFEARFAPLATGSPGARVVPHDDATIPQA